MALDTFFPSATLLLLEGDAVYQVARPGKEEEPRDVEVDQFLEPAGAPYVYRVWSHLDLESRLHCVNESLLQRDPLPLANLLLDVFLEVFPAPELLLIAHAVGLGSLGLLPA